MAWLSEYSQQSYAGHARRLDRAVVAKPRPPAVTIARGHQPELHGFPRSGPRVPVTVMILQMKVDVLCPQHDELHTSRAGVVVAPVMAVGYLLVFLFDDGPSAGQSASDRARRSVDIGRTVGQRGRRHGQELQKEECASTQGHLVLPPSDTWPVPSSAYGPASEVCP